MIISILYQASIITSASASDKHNLTNITCSFESYRNKEHLKGYIFYGSLYTK